jgi:transposase
MAREPSELTDEPWAMMAPLLPTLKASARGGPKPLPHRPVFEGILWMLRAGARWQDLPRRFPSPRTCWRRRRDWEAQGPWSKAWQALLAQLEAQGRRDGADAFADGSVAPATKGGRASGKRSVAKARSGWWWSAAKGCLWGTSWHRRPRRKSPCWRRPSRPSLSLALVPAAPARGPRGSSPIKRGMRRRCVSAWRSVVSM